MAAPAVSATRLAAIDQLRGLVMIVMALDHARDFFSSAPFDPLDLARTTPALFLTRWVTHFCAPSFVLLAGVSAYLYGARGRTRRQLAWFLLSRGLWLIVLELTVVNFGWYFFARPGFFLAQVIWAIGWSMIALAGLLWLPGWAIGAFGLALIAGHNLLDHTGALQLGLPSWLWTVLHQPGLLHPLPGLTLEILYPLIPWIGVLAAGYALGPLFRAPAAQRTRWLLGLGLGAIAAFLALRVANLYGDPAAWTPQASRLFTVFSFFNVEKYPPSLQFLLITLGPALLVLAGLEHWRGAAAGLVGGLLALYGRVPLFYYVLHLLVLHVLAHILVTSRGLAGYDLPVVYAVWLAVVVALYPLCRWFGGIKQRRRDWWLSYL
jgi:uncharacterized membrane protein